MESSPLPRQVNPRNRPLRKLAATEIDEWWASSRGFSAIKLRRRFL
jgi:hypothetical protein